MPTLHSIFQAFHASTVSPALEKRILKTLMEMNAQALRRMFFFTYAAFAGSVAALLYTLFNFGKTLLESEFWMLSALAFSDIAVVADNWSDYAFSLLETFPALSLVAVLLPVFLLLLISIWYGKLLRTKHGYRYA